MTKRCDACRFACIQKPEVTPMNLLPKAMIFCRRLPPSPVPIPQRDGSVTITPIHPAVDAAHWCHSFEPLPPVVQ